MLKMIGEKIRQLLKESQYNNINVRRNWIQAKKRKNRHYIVVKKNSSIFEWLTLWLEIKRKNDKITRQNRKTCPSSQGFKTHISKTCRASRKYQFILKSLKIINPFYWCRNWDLWKLNDSSKVTTLAMSHSQNWNLHLLMLNPMTSPFYNTKTRRINWILAEMAGLF